MAPRARALLAKVAAWHRWFYDARDLRREGLVAILHPWESGRDNSVDWALPFQRVPTEGIAPYTRRDTQDANPAHRPTREQYDRYLWLVEHFRGLGWDNARLHDASPFQVVAPGFNAILIRSACDLAALAAALGERGIADENGGFAERGLAALDTLWSEPHGQYLSRDRSTGALVGSASSGGLLPAFAPIPAARAQVLARTIGARAEAARFNVPSHDPADPRFDSARYWRGPVWLVVNYMIAEGLRAAGHAETAHAITRSSLTLIRESGFAKYDDPLTGAALGGDRFT